MFNACDGNSDLDDAGKQTCKDNSGKAAAQDAFDAAQGEATRLADLVGPLEAKIQPAKDAVTDKEALEVTRLADQRAAQQTEVDTRRTTFETKAGLMRTAQTALDAANQAVHANTDENAR